MEELTLGKLTLGGGVALGKQNSLEILDLLPEESWF